MLSQVIQMVSLMDRLLKLENLDLQLTAYGVLATGPDEGMVEFVPSISLAQVRVPVSICAQNLMQMDCFLLLCYVYVSLVRKASHSEMLSYTLAINMFIE